ncbi:uncharacterized protein LOC144744365 [Ciona intestinalis]
MVVYTKLGLQLFLICAIFAVSTRKAEGQRDGLYPFVTVNDSQLNANNVTTKIFTTSIRISFSNPDVFSSATFTSAVQNYYGGRSGLGGFVSVANIQTTNVNISPVTVDYDVTYLYLQLKNSVVNDEGILNTIGRASVVKRGLESDTNFNNIYNVSENVQSFRFSGESLCDKVGCPQGNHMFCNEARQGASGDCRSPCKVGYCVNAGWCIQYHGNTLPICSCPSDTSTWYVGQHCQVYVHLWMPILFFVVVFLILVIIVLAFCFFYHNKPPEK